MRADKAHEQSATIRSNEGAMEHNSETSEHPLLGPYLVSILVGLAVLLKRVAVVGKGVLAAGCNALEVLNGEILEGLLHLLELTRAPVHLDADIGGQ